jgi:transcriptional regulator with XRE-family HTH domain
MAARARRAAYDKETFAERLASLRAARRLTQQQLARHAGVTARVVQRWESGRVFPNDDSVERLSAALEVSREELLGMPAAVSSTSVRDRLERIEQRQIDLVGRLEMLQGDLEVLRYDLAPLVALAKRRTIVARDGR